VTATTRGRNEVRGRAGVYVGFGVDPCTLHDSQPINELNLAAHTPGQHAKTAMEPSDPGGQGEDSTQHPFDVSVRDAVTLVPA
jgi:hypothetical protein